MRFDTLLVANRGEIACRVLRSAYDQGLRTVAVYSDADAAAPHVALADEAVRIGPGPVADSYLNAEAVLDAARASGAQAIHPGYGFLSENAGFARAVADAGLVFVGPSPEAIDSMGDKARAKIAMRDAGVPVVPGFESDDQSDATLCAAAEDIGFPVMVKASAGGGGRGMRLVESADALPEALARARSEALGAFGSDHLILEKAILAPRHVEVQVMADTQGNTVHLFERDCSLQRRHQKVIEEAPCPALSPELRAQMGAAAVAAAQSVGYVGAGTVEFLLDDSGAFYFLEMNTRLQVEHPVTEAITGLDLVALQLSVAQGAPLPVVQEDLAITGHSIEARLYAEDPANGFLPATGDISLWQPAAGEGIRVDAGIAQGQEVSPFYDPMLAKLITHGPTREVARQRLIAALKSSALAGVANNRAFLIALLENEAFVAGQATTDTLARDFPDGLPTAEARSQDVALGAALILMAEAEAALAASPMLDASLMGLGAPELPLELSAGETVHKLRAAPLAAGWQVSGDDWSHSVERDATGALAIDGRRARFAHALAADGTLDLDVEARTLRLSRHKPWQAAQDEGGSGQVRAPMPGLVIAVSVAKGDSVEAGQVLAVIEAMKMQHQIKAAIAGTVSEVAVSTGDQLATGAPMILIEGAEE